MHIYKIIVQVKKYMLPDTFIYKGSCRISVSQRHERKITMKINKLGIAAAAATLLLSAAAGSGMAACAESYYNAEADSFDIYTCISESDCSVLASYVGREDGDYKFKVIRTLKNTISEKYFYVSDDEKLADRLEAGNRYVLMLDTDISVYYEHDKYTLNGDLLISVDSTNQITGMTASDITIQNPPKSVSALKKYMGGIPDTSIPGKDYIRSSDISEITAASDAVVYAEVVRRISDSSKGCGLYSCRVIKTVKGSVKSEFNVVLFDSEVTAGKRYYLLLNKNGSSYELSSKKSIRTEI